MKAIDTNVIIRFLTRDNEDIFLKVEKIFKYAAPESIVIPDAVIAEASYVLEHIYNLKKLEIAEKLSLFLAFKAFKTNRALLLRTFYYFREKNLDFIDAYLIAGVDQDDYEAVYSFDHQMKKAGLEQVHLL